MSGHIVLIGDSIFDNAAYVRGGPSVTGHVQRLLPADWDVTLLAVDGATVSTVFHQVSKIPSTATHLVLSAGGNDALLTSDDLFSEQAANVRDALEKIGVRCREFASEYRQLIDKLRSQGLPLAACTVYDSVPGLGDAELAGLCVFNDAITRIAFGVGATLIDLRNVCDEATDYSKVSPIEPSATGGAKIARAVIDAVTDGDVAARVIV